MSPHAIRKAFLVIDTFLYVALAILGLYFIYQGEVIQRFREGKTLFTEYEEALDEFPTITTCLKGDLHPMPKYGKDFIISMGAMTETMTDLTFGENIVSGGPLKVYFEPYGQFARELRITPMNFDPTMTKNYKLKYKFNENSVAKVGLRLTTAISNLGRWTGTYNIEDEEHQCQSGQETLLIIFANKYKYLNCTKKSPLELMLQQALEELPKKCSKPCQIKPQHFSMGFELEKILDHLPFCKDKKETKCVMSVFEEARKDTFGKQCSKLEYRAIANEVDTKQGCHNEASYILALANGEAKVKVKEEYLIYDGVAMISAIGGTLGLCIGFSFYNLSNYLIGWLEVRIKSINVKR